MVNQLCCAAMWGIAMGNVLNVTNDLIISLFLLIMLIQFRVNGALILSFIVWGLLISVVWPESTLLLCINSLPLSTCLIIH